MKCIARPVVVDAHPIVSVASVPNPDGSLNVATSDGENRAATAEMLARMTPVAGDYWVIQADGYEYLNPKAVFERKYVPAPAYDNGQPSEQESAS